MAEDIYERAAALVAEKLALRGETIILRRRVPVVDEDQPNRVTETISTDYELSSLWTQYNVDKIDGELILQGDQQVTIGALDFPDAVPTLDVLIRYPEAQSQVWRIIRSRPIRRGATDVAFELQVRRADEVDE